MLELPAAPTAQRSHKPVLAAVLALLILAGGAAAAVLWPEADEPAAAVPTPKPSRALTPFEQGLNVLEAQAAALSKGDEKAWLAPVDTKQPKLVARYRTTFRNLRGLGVGPVEYHGRPGSVSTSAKAIVSATFSYCFTGATCPEWRNTYSSGPPKLYQDVTLTRRGDRYVITALETTRNQGALSAPPWEGPALSFATGKRVVVAGSSSQKKYLKRFLKAADKAAAVADRYAGLIGNKQNARYRIYLADEKSWKNWYGGNDSSWAIGYAIPLNAAGTDIVLRTRKVLQEEDISLIIQHELGHVATLAGLSSRDTDDDQWLVEGIAEYIGAYPKKPQNTYSRYVLADAFRKRGSPKSIAVKSLTDDADDLTVSTLYAMGHYATGCMAAKYGEPKLMRFADLVLRQGQKPAAAAPTAFGKPFAAVDKACLSWIKSRV